MSGNRDLDSLRLMRHQWTIGGILAWITLVAVVLGLGRIALPALSDHPVHYLTFHCISGGMILLSSRLAVGEFSPGFRLLLTVGAAGVGSVVFAHAVGQRSDQGSFFLILLLVGILTLGGIAGWEALKLHSSHVK
jgi:hypothetical protein